MLVVIGGLPTTGKTTLARLPAAEMGAGEQARRPRLRGDTQVGPATAPRRPARGSPAAVSRMPGSRSPPVPLLREQFVRPHPVGVVVRDGRDEQFVSPGGFLELQQAVGHLPR